VGDCVVLGVPEVLADADGVCVTLGLYDGVPDMDAVAEELGVPEDDTDAVGVPDGVADELGVPEADADGDTDGSWLPAQIWVKRSGAPKATVPNCLLIDTDDA